MFPANYFPKSYFYGEYFPPVEGEPAPPSPKSAGFGGGASGHQKGSKRKWQRDDEEILVTLW